jgi:predicted N-formylglutamate amidohydrolase
MDIHGERNGYPHVLLEIRQDLIGHDEGVAEWARLIHRHLKQVLAKVDLA